MLYYVKPHNEYICSISVDSDFDFDSQWTLMGETATHFYMNTDNIDKAYAVAKALSVSITTVNTTWEIDPCLLEYDTMYLDTLQWTVEYWDSLPVEMINAIVATGDTYGFDLYTKAYAYMCNGVTVYNNPDIDWDAPAPELPDDECTAIVYCPVQPASIVLIHDIKLDDVELYDAPDGEVLSPVEDMMLTLQLQLAGAEMDFELNETVRDDVKLLPPVIEPVDVIEVITPQEVVSEPQEDCLSTTTNEDKTMSIILPDFSTNGNTFTLVPVEFTSIWYEVPTVDVVELNGQYSELTCDVLSGQFTELAYPLMSPLTCDVMNGQSSDVLEGWTGKASHLTSHISDGWFGQCCLLTERPLSTEEREAVEHKVEQFANGKKAHVKSYKRELRPTQEIETLARIKELVEQSQVPTITTKSGKVVPVSPHCVTPYGNAPVSSRVTSPKVTSAIGEASAIDPVDEYKSTLFNLNDYDITRNIVVDVATTTPATPKATPKVPVSTAKFASNFNSSVIAKYTALNGGIIKDSLVLNKLTSALRANDMEAYNKYVTIFNNPVAVSLHRQAYDAVVSAS